MREQPYVGAKAAEYEKKRLTQNKWHRENEIVERMLKEISPVTVLDAPVGTGRFLPLYKKLMVCVTGVDLSHDMIELARKRAGLRKQVTLMVGDLREPNLRGLKFDAVLCVRLLHLMKRADMERTLRGLLERAKLGVILTIQMRDEYHETKGDTVTHDERRFRRLVESEGWRIADDCKITGAGWHVIRLEKK